MSAEVAPLCETPLWMMKFTVPSSPDLASMSTRVAYHSLPPRYLDDFRRIRKPTFGLQSLRTVDQTTPAQQPHDPLFDEIQKLHTGLEHLKSKSNVSDHQSIRRCYRRSQHCFSFAMRCHGSKPSPSRDAESLFLRLRRTPSDTALKHEGLTRHGGSKSL